MRIARPTAAGHNPSVTCGDTSPYTGEAAVWRLWWTVAGKGWRNSPHPPLTRSPLPAGECFLLACLVAHSSGQWLARGGGGGTKYVGEGSALPQANLLHTAKSTEGARTVSTTDTVENIFTAGGQSPPLQGFCDFFASVDSSKHLLAPSCPDPALSS